MMYVDQEHCVGCGACESVCPCDAIWVDEYAYIDTEKCICCGECGVECPVCAIGDDGNGSYDFDSDFDMNLFGDSDDFWAGTPYEWGGADSSGIDCSHLVWLIYCENGLNYNYAPTSTFANLSQFLPVSSPQDGDVILWPGHHMGIYIENPPTAGYNIYSATSSGGVRYGRISWWSGTYGTPQYYRYNGGN